MRDVNENELELVGGGDGDPTYAPTQSPQEIENLLKQIQNLYRRPGTV